MRSATASAWVRSRRPLRLERDAFKISVSLGGGACDGVLLFHSQTASFYLVHCGDGDRMAILPHLDGLALPGEQHAFIGGRFPYLVGAVGQDVAARAGVA